MPITCYMTATSGPCRIVRLAAAALDLELNLVPVDLVTLENADPNFIKVNPQQTVPTIVDKDFVLTEHNTIARYLVNRYAPDSGLYSKDPKVRALIDQRLDFNLGMLYPRFGSYFFPMLNTGGSTAAATEKLDEALGYLNIFLENYSYVASDEMSIADLALATTISNVEAIGVEIKKFNEIDRWYDTIKMQAPGFDEINREAVEELKLVLQELKMKFGPGTDALN